MSNRAAVLIALKVLDTNDIHVVLTERAKEMRKHAGEVALPGGRYEPEDGSLLVTALREAHEERFITDDPRLPFSRLKNATSVQYCGEKGGETSFDNVLTTLRLFLSRFHLLVTPVVGVITQEFEPTLNPSEVASCFTVPLRTFLEAKTHTATDIIWNGYPYRSHTFMVNDYKIWGLTAEILITAAKVAYGEDRLEFEVLAPGQPSVDAALADDESLNGFRSRLQKL
ncbi:hypothetical protein HK097_006938 [Rhizophlyctis rosea]|uniref:Nudix hydrolase domain-containing protein n=1 Tax=Rhizophlyctis rosea TaxID=64517 RepID=A0AAD5SQN7_9FUNG|nr:hypothetical protein HK097_006938 [Rhizophlyctis rosea]